MIQVDNEFIVVGGGRSRGKNIPTESCKLNGQSMTCTTREPKLSLSTAEHDIFHALVSDLRSDYSATLLFS